MLKHRPDICVDCGLLIMFFDLSELLDREKVTFK